MPISDPYFLPSQQVDKGAIRFVLSGANIMCPGLTSKGACMTPAPKGTIVVSFKTLFNSFTFLEIFKFYRSLRKNYL